MGDSLNEKFERMGTRVKVTDVPAGRAATVRVSRHITVRLPVTQPVRIDVRRDNRGEYFELTRREGVDVQVVDVDRRDRHLLLLVREPGERTVTKSKFLCGHDERSWFVAAVPEVRGVSDVATAKEALKPDSVRDAQARFGVRSKDRGRRRTAAYVRQGEWFFIPQPGMNLQPDAVNEPIRRGGGKPHVCQYLARTGGRSVHVHDQYPNGLTSAEFVRLPKRERLMPGWRFMVRDAGVYVNGTVRHPDHKTIVLHGWHRVEMNTESRAAPMRHVAFLD